KAGKELGIEVVWKGSQVENDLKGEIDVVENFISQNISGIALAPQDHKAMVNPVHDAMAAKIPVLIWDSDLDGQAPNDFVSFVATDNFAAGQLAADALGKALGGKGKVAMLRYLEGSASTAKREDGFLDGLKKHYPDIKVVSENQYAGPSTESAFAKSESLLASVKAPSGGIQGVYAPNESAAFGMLLALRKIGLAGKIKFVGFDTSTKLLEGLRAGEINGLVAQDPFNMGYLAVKTLVSAIKGEKVEPRIDTGAKVITKENIEDPAIKELLTPDLKKWLQE
ncbi:MAG TPA: substrate-binding domain-containing protein, partial [Chloroflexota bacterium]|nr:substrate-binding domain-containing protein [Chloroflexota bacterium]